jgi:hypothetical protein
MVGRGIGQCTLVQVSLVQVSFAAADKSATSRAAGASSGHPASGLVVCNGVGEIRTHGTVSRSAVFKTAAFNHSATTPAGKLL